MEYLNRKMTDLAANNTFVIAGIVFITIAVIGQSKLGFIEINPGCFGRFLALIIGISSLLYALGLLNFSVANIDSLKNYLLELIQQSLNSINELLQGS
ncbi:MAG: hypothetical protein FWK04_24420 [Nostoc sp. GBBB01]|uniref:Uncharacterized protein n=2 Tax=Nostoc punctiforme TaxID=272131 RepID=A0ABR8HM37_NOSPU|nr:hypothetical protein [Nostoc punctiforme FACHB-252]MBL1202121.1 hypothetical protein [Nostoc sp. GBBB01]